MFKKKILPFIKYDYFILNLNQDYFIKKNMLINLLNFNNENPYL